MSKNRYMALVASLILGVTGCVEAATYTAASVSLADVRAAVALATNGDTVIIPAGTNDWTGTLTNSLGITIQGAGTNATIVLDSVVPINYSGPFLMVFLSSNQTFRLTGITFQGGSRSNLPYGGGLLVRGTCNSVRIDHCYFNSLQQEDVIHVEGNIQGVIDHCRFDNNASGGIMVLHDTWGGGDYGDGSWADSAHFGSSQFLFIEDCIFSNGVTQYTTTQNIDSYGGGRYVCRHNFFYNCKTCMHGTESPGRSRSCRAAEVYSNTFVCTLSSPSQLGQDRGGTLLWYGNIYTGSWYTSIYLPVYRHEYPFKYWGGANGNNPWDSNDVHGVYASGFHTGADGSGALVTTGVSWTVNQWVGYEISNTNQIFPDIGGFSGNSYITSNTSDTISFVRDDTYGTALTFNNGDYFAVYRVMVALDQPGRGKGDLLVGWPPYNTVTGTNTWPHQVLEPCYSWGNTINGVDAPFAPSPVPTVQVNRDYYNDTPMPGYVPYTYPHPLTNVGVHRSFLIRSN